MTVASRGSRGARPCSPADLDEQLNDPPPMAHDRGSRSPAQVLGSTPRGSMLAWIRDLHHATFVAAPRRRGSLEPDALTTRRARFGGSTIPMLRHRSARLAL